MLPLNLPEDRTELQLVLSAVRDIGQECLLKRWVEILVEEHKFQPPIVQEGGKNLANAEVGRVGSIFCSRPFWNQLYRCCPPLMRHNREDPAEVEEADQSRDQSRTFLEDNVPNPVKGMVQRWLSFS